MRVEIKHVPYTQFDIFIISRFPCKNPHGSKSIISSINKYTEVFQDRLVYWIGYLLERDEQVPGVL